MLTEAQEVELVEAAGREMRQRENAGPFVLEIMPDNRGYKRQRTKRVIEQFIDLVSEPGSRLRELLEMRNNPELDS